MRAVLGEGRSPTFMDLLKWHCIQIKPSACTVLPTDKKARALEGLEMLHDGDATYIEFRCEFANRDPGKSAHDIHHFSTVLVSERMKNGIHII